jgi:signal peptidase I
MTEAAAGAPAAKATSAHTRRPWVAALFSLLVPGLGQLYAGRLKRALGAFAVTWFFLLLVFGLIRFAPGRLAVAIMVVSILVALAVIVDGYQCARRAADPYELARYNRWYVYAAAIALMVLLFRPIKVSEWIFGATRTWSIPSTSMAPTFIVGDKVWSVVLAPGPIPRGTLAVFYAPKLNEPVVKRIAGVPGDTLAMRNGILSLNGATPREAYLDPPGDCGGIEPDSARRNWGPLVVAPDTYFMLGDNRDCAIDSRAYGAVGRQAIFQRAALIYFSHDSAGTQWDRIGLVPK